MAKDRDGKRSTAAPIYLDNAATTRPRGEVVDAMADAHLDAFGNPSSTHPFGAAARRLLQDAREFLRGSLGAQSLVFTSGGTEADVLALLGVTAGKPPGRVLVGAADHAAVRSLKGALAQRRHELVEIPVDRHGDIEEEALFELMGKDVRAVSLLHGHNELGTIPRTAALAEVARQVAPDCHVHVDLVQAYGKIDFDLDLEGVDSVAVSGHKLHGPRGIGFLALSSKAKVLPLWSGGGQEEGLRGGTENVAGAVGLACAAEHALSHLHEHAARMTDLLDELFEQLQEELPDIVRLGHPERRLPHVLSVRIPDCNGQALQEACAARGVAFSTGSACHEGQDAPNHVLQAIGLGRRRAREVVRFSVCPATRFDEVDEAAAIILDEAERLRAMAPTDPRGGARRKD